MADDLTPDPGPEMAIATGLNATQDPQGNWWIGHTIQLGALSFTYGIPLEQATTYADNFAAHMRSLVKETKRQASGIVLPTDGTTVRNHNGIHLPRNRRR